MFRLTPLKTEVLKGNYVEGGQLLIAEQAEQKVWHSKKMSCLGTKDILFGGNDITAALTDKGQNRLWWW